MAKLSSEDFIQKYSDKIKDNDDLLLEIMEDASDSIVEPIDRTEEISGLQSEVEKLQAENQSLKDKYKSRFMGNSEEFNRPQPVQFKIEEPVEETVIDIHEI